MNSHLTQYSSSLHYKEEKDDNYNLYNEDWRSKTVDQWSENDVYNWLLSSSKLTMVPFDQLPFEQFRTINGKQLVNYKLSDFVEKDQKNGVLLYLYLSDILSHHKGSTCRSQFIPAVTSSVAQLEPSIITHSSPLTETSNSTSTHILTNAWKDKSLSDWSCFDVYHWLLHLCKENQIPLDKFPFYEFEDFDGMRLLLLSGNEYEKKCRQYGIFIYQSVNQLVLHHTNSGTSDPLSSQLSVHRTSPSSSSISDHYSPNIQGSYLNPPLSPRLSYDSNDPYELGRSHLTHPQILQDPYYDLDKHKSNNESYHSTNHPRQYAATQRPYSTTATYPSINNPCYLNNLILEPGTEQQHVKYKDSPYSKNDPPLNQHAPTLGDYNEYLHETYSYDSLISRAHCDLEPQDERTITNMDNHLNYNVQDLTNVSSRTGKAANNRSSQLSNTYEFNVSNIHNEDDKFRKDNKMSNVNCGDHPKLVLPRYIDPLARDHKMNNQAYVLNYEHPKYDSYNSNLYIGGVHGSYDHLNSHGDKLNNNVIHPGTKVQNIKTERGHEKSNLDPIKPNMPQYMNDSKDTSELISAKTKQVEGKICKDEDKILNNNHLRNGLNNQFIYSAPTHPGYHHITANSLKGRPGEFHPNIIQHEDPYLTKKKNSPEKLNNLLKIDNVIKADKQKEKTSRAGKDKQDSQFVDMDNNVLKNVIEKPAPAMNGIPLSVLTAYHNNGHIKMKIKPVTNPDEWKKKKIKEWSQDDVRHWFSHISPELGLVSHKFPYNLFPEDLDGIKFLEMKKSDFTKKYRKLGEVIYTKLEELIVKESCDDCDKTTTLQRSHSSSNQSYSDDEDYEDDSDDDHDDSHRSDQPSTSSDPIPRRRPGRPKGVSNKNSKKKEKLGKVWQFLISLLHNSQYNPTLICWENYEEGKFRFVQSDKVAALWGDTKKNETYNYEKFSRAMRYYYKHDILRSVDGRLIYQFGLNAVGWRTEYPIDAGERPCGKKI